MCVPNSRAETRTTVTAPEHIRIIGELAPQQPISFVLRQRSVLALLNTIVLKSAGGSTSYVPHSSFRTYEVNRKAMSGAETACPKSNLQPMYLRSLMFQSMCT